MDYQWSGIIPKLHCQIRCILNVESLSNDSIRIKEIRIVSGQELYT